MFVARWDEKQMITPLAAALKASMSTLWNKASDKAKPCGTKTSACNYIYVHMYICIYLYVCAPKNANTLLHKLQYLQTFIKILTSSTTISTHAWYVVFVVIIAKCCYVFQLTCCTRRILIFGRASGYKHFCFPFFIIFYASSYTSKQKKKFYQMSRQKYEGSLISALVNMLHIHKLVTGNLIPVKSICSFYEIYLYLQIFIFPLLL